MFKSTEWNKEGEAIDNTVDELADIRNKIAAAERGINLANQLDDMDRLAQMMSTLQALQAKEQEIEHRRNESAANQSAFDEATDRENMLKQKIA